jgi:hypothetical protein
LNDFKKYFFCFVVQRRDEEEEGVTAQPELFGLGDRLNTKLTQEKAGLASKLSNYSCILQELKIVDKVIS